MKEYRNAELEKFLEKVYDLDWSYNLYKEDDNCTYAELEKYSPLGEDFSMTVHFSEHNPEGSFLEDLRNSYIGFDPDEHAEMWIENRGENGTPNSIRDLINDALDIEKMIYELIQYLEGDDKERDIKIASFHTKMNVGYLKEVIKDLPDNTPIFVACQGLCNYDFDRGQPCDDTDTFGIVHDGKLFITDECAVDIGNGETL